MPILWMMFSVFTWSLYPLVGVWGTDTLNIFEYVMFAGLISVFFSYLFFKCIPAKGKKINMPRFLDLDFKTKKEIIIGSLLGMLSFVSLLGSFQFMSRAGATIIFEIWPILVMFISPFFIQKAWEKISRRDYIFSFLSLVGIVIITFPEFQTDIFTSVTHWTQYSILLLPLFGGICMAFSSALKARASHQLEIKDSPMASLLLVQTYFGFFSALATIPFILFWPDKESVYTWQNIGGVFFVGFVIYTLGNLAYTHALLRSSKSNIVVLWYLVPVLSVVWLWLAGETEITPYIILGSGFIISANLVTTIKADTSKAYQAAVFTLLVSGAFSFFFMGHEMNDFFDAISVPIIFFTILVAFMMDRLLTRDTTEEGLAVSIMNKVNYLTHINENQKHIICQSVIDIITTNDTSKMNASYTFIRAQELGDEPELPTQLDKLLLSKTQSTSFAEIFILMLVGVLIITMAMIYHPTTFIGDCFAVIITTTLVFILFNVFDITNKRREFSLSLTQGEKPKLADQQTDLKSERIISIILLFLIMASYISLFYYKHHIGI